jgi:hypothetical protein
MRPGAPSVNAKTALIALLKKEHFQLESRADIGPSFDR